MKTELKTPRITVQNTTGDSWQVTAEGLIGGEEGLETVSFTVLVPRSDASLTDLTVQAVKRAINLLQLHQDVAASR